MLVVAVAAEADISQLAALYLAAGAAVNFAVLGTGHWDLVQVDHCIAVAADEVNVGIGVGIEPFHTLDRSHAHDLALVFEVGQVPVHRCQGDVRMLRLEHLVNHLCRGVQVRALQAGEDSVTFPECFAGSFHSHQPFVFVNDSYLRDEYTMLYPVCQEENKNYSQIIFSGKSSTFPLHQTERFGKIKCKRILQTQR